MLKSLRTLPAITLLVGFLACLFVLGLRQTGLLQPLELTVYDWWMRLQPHAAAPDQRIVRISVTEEDIRAHGHPISDATMAEALMRVAKEEPRAIGLDIYRDLEVPPGREALNRVLLDYPFIICVTNFAGVPGSRVPPPPVLEGTEQVGFNDLIPDDDGSVRRALLFQDDGQHVAFAFALRLAFLYLSSAGVDPQPDPEVPDFLRLGAVTLRPFRGSDGAYVHADDGGYQILVDFQGPQASARTMTLSTLLDGAAEPGVFEDKVVLIGGTAESLPDIVNVPYGMVHGVEVHAHIISQLLRAGLDGHPPMRSISDRLEMLWVLAWGLAGALIGLVLRSPWRFVLAVVAGLVLLGLATLLLFWKGWWVPVVPPGLVWSLSVSLVTAVILKQERRDRVLLRQLFGQHVSQDVAEAIWLQREQFLHGGRPRSQQVVATVLFADFKGYTAASEKMEPQALMDWLNGYLNEMSRLVTDHKGFVDDYWGDAIKADFFDPLKGIGGAAPHERDPAINALNAVRCALAIEQAMHRLNTQHGEQGLPTVGMRIGIHTGPVVAGTVGSTHRMKYTTVGDTVNTAARLESLDRDSRQETGAGHTCRILIGETTARLVGTAVPVMEVGNLTVKGKAQPVMVYQIVSGGWAPS